jgi:hypothetical protein
MVDGAFFLNALLIQQGAEFDFAVIITFFHFHFSL